VAPGIEAQASEASSMVVWISVVPGTLPHATIVEIANRTQHSAAITAPVIDGGFDPLEIAANAGDTLDVTTWRDDGTKDPMVVKVPAKRPPAVVRSNPPRGRTAVALNVNVSVVFTEPVNPATVTGASLQLLREGRPVTGRSVLSSDGWEAQFTPDEPLVPGTTYEIAVTRDVKDITGDPLESIYSATFVTGTEVCSAESGCSGTSRNIVTGKVWTTSSSGRVGFPSAQIAAWFQPLTGPGYLIDGPLTDVQGNYSLGPLPDGTLQIRADRPGYDQPCGVNITLAGRGGTVDIDLILSREENSALATARPRMWGGTGYLLNESPNVFRFVTVPGVRVTFEAPDGFVAMRTTSDAEGHYAFCNVPRGRPAKLSAVAPEFKLFSQPFTVPAESLDFVTSFAYDIFLEK
jgi:hypothetical protein